MSTGGYMTGLRRGRRIIEAFRAGTAIADIADGEQVSAASVAVVLRQAGVIDTDTAAAEPEPVLDSDRAAVVCLQVRCMDYQISICDDRASATAIAEHGSYWGCGSKHCVRRHMVVTLRGGRYRSTTYGPSQICKCPAC